MSITMKNPAVDMVMPGIGFDFINSAWIVRRFLNCHRVFEVLLQDQTMIMTVAITSKVVPTHDAPIKARPTIPPRTITSAATRYIHSALMRELHRLIMAYAVF